MDAEHNKLLQDLRWEQKDQRKFPPTSDDIPFEEKILPLYLIDLVDEETRRDTGDYDETDSHGSVGGRNEYGANGEIKEDNDHNTTNFPAADGS